MHPSSVILSCIQHPALPADAYNIDALSTGSDFMDILLQEDTFSATCSVSSAVSESLTFGSHGNGTSGSQTGGLHFGFCYSTFVKPGNVRRFPL